MQLPFFGRRNEDSYGRRLVEERERAARQLRAATHGAPERDRPWGKEWLAIRRKKEWMLAGAIGFVFLLYKQAGGDQAFWIAATTAGGVLLPHWWLKWRQQMAEKAREPVLALRDARSNARGAPDRSAPRSPRGA